MPSLDRVAEIVAILRQNGGGAEFVESDHDVIWWGAKPARGELPDHLIKKLDDLGCHWSDEYDCWTSFT